jgi:hypothetical protein
MKGLLAILTLIFAFSAAAQAEEASSSSSQSQATPDAQNPTYMICKLKGSVRTLRVHKKDGGGCQTTYTKEGVDKVVSEAWATKSCEKVLLNIRDNLEKASWKCKDISEARVSFSEN